HQRVAKPAHRWFVFSGLLLIMTSIFIKCLPLAPIIVLVVCSLATPKAEASLVEDGIAALKAGETTTAQQLFSEAAKDSSGDHAASLYLASGSAASRAQDWPTAVTSFSSALSAEDSEILQQAHYALATSLFYLGASKTTEEKVKAWEGSIEHFKASLEIQPQNAASRENLQSVEKQLAELQKEKEKKEEEKNQEKEDENNQDSEKNDSQEEAQNDPDSEDTSEESKDEQSNENPDQTKKDDPSEENGDKNKTEQSREGESKNDEQSEKSKPNDEQSNQNENQSNEGETKQGNENKAQAGNPNLKDDPNAPENETPRERARRLLKQYSDFGGKAPRRIRRPYNRSPHDW
ncbi:hypothetical protein N8650_02315, partial [Akkermansiaceae bacterium]|nr:hypothetical protein [Akkermansiaceae bacterium]